MRLPIEDDWRPTLQRTESKDDGYEEHVRMLALRLKEAHKLAGQQSKISHQKAKRYYDEHTKLEQFSKGDLVYLYDPIYKRGKARKFAYKYKGPYEIKQRISPLVCKVQADRCYCTCEPFKTGPCAKLAITGKTVYYIRTSYH